MKIEEKNKTRELKWFLVFGIMLFFNFVGAQTIGGEVYFSEYMVPNWQNVFVYDVNDVNDYFEVEVSPEDFKYSFGNSGLFGKNAFISAEILDFENGLMAGPVEMNLSWDNSKQYSENDYDIFSPMEFRKVVQVKEPLKELIISEEGEFDVGLNVYDDCDLYLQDELLCERGCDYSEIFEKGFGLNELNFIIDCGVGKRFKGGSRDLFESRDDLWVNFEKEIYFFSEDFFHVIYSGEKHSNISILTDFIPSEFEVINVSGGGKVFEEDGYYAIEWKNVSSDFFEFSYYIKLKNKLKNCEVGLNSGEVLKDRFSEEFNLFNQSLNLKENNFYFDCVFSEDIGFYLIEKVNFEKEMDNKIKIGEKKKVELSGNLSENVSGVEFREYVPVEFDISSISNGGVVEISNSDYNVIVWSVEGKEFYFDYTISPNTLGDFYLMSEFGGNLLEENSLNVYRVVSSGNKKRRK
ncbi:MAG TPA: hypothetical protein VJ895_01625, partial [Candidatus Nanoarchaeia archaeon]|nr:hypothetical protein [Candidatus Nanoarchaeia archaeon]